jgi:hypothetical protein
VVRGSVTSASEPFFSCDQHTNTAWGQYHTWQQSQTEKGWGSGGNHSSSARLTFSSASSSDSAIALALPPAFLLSTFCFFFLGCLADSSSSSSAAAGFLDLDLLLLEEAFFLSPFALDCR